jgi:hypothetical protein
VSQAARKHQFRKAINQMAAQYPNSIVSLSTKNDGDTIFASHVDALQDETIAVETALLNGFQHALRGLNDNTFDLGDGAHAWRDLFVKRNLTHQGYAGIGALLISNASKQVVEQALTNGQLLVGSTGAAPVATTLTAGVGVTVTNAAGSITLASTGPVLDRQVTLQTVVNTTVETTVYTFAVAGGTLGTNKTLHLSLIGDFLNNSGASCTLTVRVKYGGTTIFQAAITNVNTGANRAPLLLDVEITAANATNAQRAKTVWFYDAVNSGGVAGIAVTKDYVGGGGQGVLAAGSGFGFAVHNAVAEDSTASKNLVITFQSGTANASIDMRAHTVYVELK